MKCPPPPGSVRPGGAPLAEPGTPALLSAALAREPAREWKIGPLGHALHALTIYQERAWGTVLPGGIAAFHGGMRPVTTTQLAEVPADGDDSREERPPRR